MSKSYQIGGVLFYKLRHMKLINILKHYGRHEDGLISGKVLSPSILESRDLVITGAENRYRMHLYRSRVEKPTQQLPDEAWSMADKRKIYRYIGRADQHDSACSLVPIVGDHPVADRLLHHAAAGATTRIGDLSE